MAENDLIITLTAVDNASGPIKSALKDVDNAQISVKKSGEEAGKTIQQQFKEAGKELRNFRQTALLLTGSLATIISTTKEAAKYSKEAKQTYEGFTKAITSLSVTVGQMLAPALEGVTKIATILRDTLEASVAGAIKVGSFLSEFFTNLNQGPVAAYQRAVAVANDATDQFLNKIEETRARVEAGISLESIAKQQINLDKIVIDGQKKTKQNWEEQKIAITQFGSALKEAEVLGKGFAKAAAAVAIGMAIINTAEGITKAMTYGPFIGPAFAAIVAATGALQIATISAQSFAVGTPNVPSDMMAQVHQGETIIPATFADSIRRGELSLSGAGGGGGNGDILINLYGVTINSKENVRELAEELGFEIDRKFRNARTRV